MTRVGTRVLLAIAVVACAVAVSACVGQPSAQTPTPSVQPEPVPSTAPTPEPTFPPVAVPKSGTSSRTPNATTVPGDVSKAIIITTPKAKAVVASPILVKGTADVFEAQFRIRVLDSHGNNLSHEVVHATSGTGTRGSFETTIGYAAGHAGPGFIMAFQFSPKDGSEIDKVFVPVVLR